MLVPEKCLSIHFRIGFHWWCYCCCVSTNSKRQCVYATKSSIALLHETTNWYAEAYAKQINENEIFFDQRETEPSRRNVEKENKKRKMKRFFEFRFTSSYIKFDTDLLKALMVRYTSCFRRTISRLRAHWHSTHTMWHTYALYICLPWNINVCSILCICKRHDCNLNIQCYIGT